MHGVGAGETQWQRPESETALKDPFVPSATFAGARQGYHFKMGAKGLGYYEDINISASDTAGLPPYPLSCVPAFKPPLVWALCLPLVLACVAWASVQAIMCVAHCMWVRVQPQIGCCAAVAVDRPVICATAHTAC